MTKAKWGSTGTLDEESSLDDDESKRLEDCSLSDSSSSTDEGEDLAQALGPLEESSDEEPEIPREPIIERYIQHPCWSQTRPDIVSFGTVAEYEALAVGVEMVVQKLLQEQPYNTIGNILRFYKSYKSSEQPLTSYFKNLNATLTPNQHTCVGLGLILLSRINALYPHLAGKCYIASSEEDIDQVPLYFSRPPWNPHDATEKEHVVVACRIKVGSREGVLLLDPGYHIARVITVMKDHSYPHTGWFRHTEEAWVQRDYCYSFPENTSDYVEWEIKETRPNKSPYLMTNSVFVGSNYLSAVSVTEKRNLVYYYRSLLSRNTKGEVTSGVHFAIEHLSANPVVNIIYTNGKGIKSRGKIPFKSIICQNLTSEEREMLDSVQENVDEGVNIMDLLLETSELLGDRPFVDSLRLINCSINITGT